MPRQLEVPIPTAADLQRPAELTFSPRTDILDAIDRLVAQRTPAAPVVDSTSQLLGMLTEKDCVRILMAGGFHSQRRGLVAEYMSKVRLALAPEMDLFRVAEIFLDNNFPMLPVVSDGRLCGQISRQNVLQGVQALRTRLDREVRRSDEGIPEPERPRSIQGMQQAYARLTPEQMAALLRRRH